MKTVFFLLLAISAIVAYASALPASGNPDVQLLDQEAVASTVDEKEELQGAEHRWGGYGGYGRGWGGYGGYGRGWGGYGGYGGWGGGYGGYGRWGWGK